MKFSDSFHLTMLNLSDVISKLHAFAVSVINIQLCLLWVPI